MPSQPFLSDSEQVLLYKIADAVVSGGGGGGGAGVSSFNTRTGAVTLELADISSLADARYVLKGGDTMTGGLIAPSLTASTLVATPLLSVTANANASAVTAAGYSVTGAGATNMVDLAGTWNTSGNPTALKLNITNTASGATAKLFDLQVGGATRLNVSAVGLTTLTPSADGAGLQIFHTSSVAGGESVGLDISSISDNETDPTGAINIDRRDNPDVGGWFIRGRFWNGATYEEQFSIDQTGGATFSGVTATGGLNFGSGLSLNGSSANFGSAGLTVGTISQTAASSQTKHTISGFSLAAGSTPIVSWAGTWNTAGNPTAFLLNITNTTSGAGSKFLDFQIGGSTRFQISKDGGPGFFGSSAAAQQVSGANLTNNVTAGGTDNTIANYTDLTTYATDAAAIRNNIYQLARKLKQINDGLRAYGLFT